MKSCNEFRRIFLKAESYKVKIRSLNKKMNAYFKVWDRWHTDLGIDIHKEEPNKKEVMENFETFSEMTSGIPPAFSAKHSTVLKHLDKKKHIPVNFGTDFINFDRNTKKLENYLKFDDAFYKKKRKKRKSKGITDKYGACPIALRVSPPPNKDSVENGNSLGSAITASLKRKHEGWSSDQHADAKLKKFKENGPIPTTVQLDSKVASD